MVHKSCLESQFSSLQGIFFSTSALHYTDEMLTVASQQQLRIGYLTLSFTQVIYPGHLYYALSLT